MVANEFISLLKSKDGFVENKKPHEEAVPIEGLSIIKRRESPHGGSSLWIGECCVWSGAAPLEAALRYAEKLEGEIKKLL